LKEDRHYDLKKPYFLRKQREFSFEKVSVEKINEKETAASFTQKTKHFEEKQQLK
jgi:hypothetical protein